MKKLLFVICCILCILTLKVDLYASSDEQLKTITNYSSINDEFKGYEGLETTISGKVGYNLALNTNDNEHTLLLGFTPYNDIGYSISTGWRIKLPYLNIEEKKGFYQDASSSIYLIDNNNNGMNFINYPSTYKLTENSNNSGYILEKEYGNKEYFSKIGTIIKSIDEFGNITNYIYKNDSLSKILYSDGTSIILERENLNKMVIKYVKENDFDILANIDLQTQESGLQELLKVEYDGNEINFEYINLNKVLLLKKYSIKDSYERIIIYDDEIDKNRIKNLTTYYNDGTKELKKYYYNTESKIEKLIDGNLGEETYNYIQGKDDSLIINTEKKYGGNISSTSETINKLGQTIKYVDGENILELKYNTNNKIVEEKENNKNIIYTYTKQGNILQKKFSNGDIIKYDYYKDGTLKKIDSNIEEIDNVLLGNIKDLNQNKTMLLSAKSGVKILYNINNNVGVTNFHTYYGLTQSGFNCYTFAIGKYKELRNPGYYSGRSLNLSSLSGIKLNVEKDIKKLGKSIYDSTVGASIPGHSWKIALRIKSGVDYHFMKISNVSGAAWQQKSGKSGPVLQFRGGRTPSNTSWDMYKYNKIKDKYVVYQTGFYDSAIKYMMIKD